MTFQPTYIIEGSNHSNYHLLLMTLCLGPLSSSPLVIPKPQNRLLRTVGTWAIELFLLSDLILVPFSNLFLASPNPSQPLTVPVLHSGWLSLAFTDERTGRTYLLWSYPLQQRMEVEDIGKVKQTWALRATEDILEPGDGWMREIKFLFV